MNRVDVIRGLIGKKKAGGYKPKGVHAEANGLPSSVHKNCPWITTGKPSSASFGVLMHAESRRTQWEKTPNSEPDEPLIKAPERKGLHHLTRIAEKLKRGWSR